MESNCGQGYSRELAPIEEKWQASSFAIGKTRGSAHCLNVQVCNRSVVFDDLGCVFDIFRWVLWLAGKGQCFGGFQCEIWTEVSRLEFWCSHKRSRNFDHGCLRI